MNKSLAFDETPAGLAQLEAEMQRVSAEIERAVEQIRRDQWEIERLRGNTQATLDRIRELLSHA